jgi:hypothetical protein
MTGFDIARLFRFVRETAGPNRGRWVHLFQSYCDGVSGDSWCADFRSFVRSIQYQGKSPELRTGSCQAALNAARAAGYSIHAMPKPDDTGYCLDASGHAFHTFIVGDVATDGRFATAEGNSNDDGSANGDRVAIRGLEHPKCRNWKVGRYLFVTLPAPSLD